jgi:surfactin synthase thioesterase subunit
MPRNKWLLTPVNRSERAGTMRLFCFPHAGGGASSYWPWIGALGPRIHIVAVQLPGRESRCLAPPPPSWDTLVSDLVNALGCLFEPPFVFFGHSLGALIAFELARTNARSGGQSVECLLVSAARAPQLPNPGPSIRALSDAELLERLRRLNGIPEPVLGNNELLGVLLPTLRSDLTLLETYDYREEPPWSCPIVAFGGSDDEKVGRRELDGWRTQIASWFATRYLPGGHFFPATSRAALLGAVRDDLEALLESRGKVR